MRRKFIEHTCAIVVAGLLAGAYSELISQKQVLAMILTFAIYVAIMIAWKS